MAVPAVFKDILSERFSDPTSITSLKMALSETWPCYHTAMDGFFEDDFIERLIDHSGPSDDMVKLHRVMSDGLMCRWLAKIGDFKDLRHAKSSIRSALGPNPTNALGRHGILWKRFVVVVMKSVETPVGDDDAGGLEIWKNAAETELMHRIPWKRNRAILFEIRPDLFYAFTPPTQHLDVLWEEYYSLEAPPWVGSGWWPKTLNRESIIKSMEKRHAEGRLPTR